MRRQHLRNSSALITGGASGLGEATARRLVAEGAHCIVLDQNEAKGNALASEVEAITFCKADTTDAEAVEKAIALAVEQAPLRVVVCCAGVGWVSRTVNREGVPHDLEIFRRVIDINLIGSFNVMRLAAATMSKNEPIEEERGVVVHTASVAAFEGQIGQIAYAASKGGIAAMTLPAARDLAKAAIRVCAIAPGTFDTPMLASLSEEVRASLAASIPNPARLGRPDEFAELVLQIVDNAYLNGTVIRLDGALRMAPR